MPQCGPPECDISDNIPHAHSWAVLWFSGHSGALEMGSETHIVGSGDVLRWHIPRGHCPPRRPADIRTHTHELRREVWTRFRGRKVSGGSGAQDAYCSTGIRNTRIQPYVRIHVRTRINPWYTLV